MPSTILSRCQRFDFKRIAPEDITARLLYVSEKENVKLTETAASLIARIADGGMRDALSLLDRCFAMGTDVDEETVRLRSHIAQLRQMLECGGVIGRKLDFLIQELNREANTIGSKCSDLELTKIVVDIKGEIEKIREQIQNIE